MILVSSEAGSAGAGGQRAGLRSTLLGGAPRKRTLGGSALIHGYTIVRLTCGMRASVPGSMILLEQFDVLREAVGHARRRCGASTTPGSVLTPSSSRLARGRGLHKLRLVLSVAYSSHVGARLGRRVRATTWQVHLRYLGILSFASYT